MIYIARQVRGEVGNFVCATEGWHARRRHRHYSGFRESRTRGRWLGYEHPDIILVFLARIAAGIDAIDLQILIGCKRRDEFALAGVRIELPPVITALDLLSIKMPAR